MRVLVSIATVAVLGLGAQSATAAHWSAPMSLGHADHVRVAVAADGSAAAVGQRLGATFVATAGPAKTFTDRRLPTSRFTKVQTILASRAVPAVAVAPRGAVMIAVGDRKGLFVLLRSRSGTPFRRIPLPSPSGDTIAVQLQVAHDPLGGWLVVDPRGITVYELSEAGALKNSQSLGRGIVQATAADGTVLRPLQVDARGRAVLVADVRWDDPHGTQFTGMQLGLNTRTAVYLRPHGTQFGAATLMAARSTDARVAVTDDGRAAVVATVARICTGIGCAGPSVVQEIGSDSAFAAPVTFERESTAPVVGLLDSGRLLVAARADRVTAMTQMPGRVLEVRVNSRGRGIRLVLARPGGLSPLHATQPAGTWLARATHRDLVSSGRWVALGWLDERGTARVSLYRASPSGV